MHITEENKQIKLYVKGDSCNHCHAEHTDEQRCSHAERQKQISIAKERGEEHIGGEMFELITTRRAEKRKRKLSGLDM